MDKMTQNETERNGNEKQQKRVRAMVIWLVIGLLVVLSGILLFWVIVSSPAGEIGFVLMLGGFITVGFTLSRILSRGKTKKKRSFFSRPLFLVPTVTIVGMLLVFVIGILWPVPEAELEEKPEEGTAEKKESIGFSLVPVSALREDNGSYTYDDGQMELVISPAADGEAAAAVEAAASVLNGESSGNDWTIVTDDSDKATVYISTGTAKGAPDRTTADRGAAADAVKVEIKKLPPSYGKENAAAVVSTLIRRAGYTKGKRDYSTAYSTYYIEAADCILYYPSQLSILSANEDNSLVIRDMRSSAALNVRLVENNYRSMDELEGFIAASEQNQILAYGPAWYSAERKKGGNTTFSYAGLGQEYIVEAELTYADQDAWVFDELRMLIKCKFIDDGIWVSKARADGYSRETAAVYGANFSRQLAAYYDAVHGTILLYPELFSQKTERYGLLEFTDPLTGASISYREDTAGYAMKDIASGYGYTESYVDGEHRVMMSDLWGGRYAVACYAETATVVAELYYPAEYEWVYEAFYGDLTIVTAADEIHNTEMQTVKIPEYGAIITIPLQFTEQSFYDGTIIFADSWNGLELSVAFSELSTPEEKTDLFACFDCIADDDNITMGDSWLRWESNAGFFYGARGAERKALMRMDAPNAARAYPTTLHLFQVEFVTGESRDVTIADEVELEAQVIQEQAAVELEKQQTEPEPAVETPEHSRPVDSGKAPNAILIYHYDYEYAYVAMDGESWFAFDESDKVGETNFGSYMIEMVKLNAVKDIISVLTYNNYTIADQSAGYLMDVVRRMDQILRSHYYDGEPVTSDLGEGIASVFETMCSVMSIQKPEYVDHRYDHVLPVRKAAPPEEEPKEHFMGYYPSVEDVWVEYCLELLLEYLMPEDEWEYFEEDDSWMEDYLEVLKDELPEEYYDAYWEKLLDHLLGDHYWEEDPESYFVDLPDEDLLEGEYWYFLWELEDFLVWYHSLLVNQGSQTMEGPEWHALLKEYEFVRDNWWEDTKSYTEAYLELYPWSEGLRMEDPWWEAYSEEERMFLSSLLNDPLQVWEVLQVSQPYFSQAVGYYDHSARDYCDQAFYYFSEAGPIVDPYASDVSHELLEALLSPENQTVHDYSWLVLTMNILTEEDADGDSWGVMLDEPRLLVAYENISLGDPPLGPFQYCGDVYYYEDPEGNSCYLLFICIL